MKIHKSKFLVADIIFIIRNSKKSLIPAQTQKNSFWGRLGFLLPRLFLNKVSYKRGFTVSNSTLSLSWLSFYMDLKLWGRYLDARPGRVSFWDFSGFTAEIYYFPITIMVCRRSLQWLLMGLLRWFFFLEAVFYGYEKSRFGNAVTYFPELVSIS